MTAAGGGPAETPQNDRDDALSRGWEAPPIEQAPPSEQSPAYGGYDPVYPAYQTPGQPYPPPPPLAGAYPPPPPSETSTRLQPPPRRTRSISGGATVTERSAVSVTVLTGAPRKR